MRKSITDEQSPAFQFYASDWISDPNRMKLSLEEQGAYILLYCHCWRSFRIPKDMEVLSRMCNCRVDKLDKIWKNISHLFEEKKDKDNKVVSGDPEKIKKVLDTWKFSKDSRSANPNWLLIDTQA